MGAICQTIPVAQSLTHSLSSEAARDEELDRFAQRRLSDPYPYLILDARYEKVRENGVIAPQAVMIAIGVDWEGRRNVLHGLRSAIPIHNMRGELRNWPCSYTAV